MIRPDDLALLNDLLDERLAPSAAEDLRRRLASDAALATEYESLAAVRRAIRSLPDPAVPALPASFAQEVRERAGLASESPPTSGVATGRVLVMRRVSLVLAASSLQEALTEIEDQLRGAGLRVTASRVAVLRVLTEADDHPRVDQVIDRVRGGGLSI